MNLNSHPSHNRKHSAAGKFTLPAIACMTSGESVFEAMWASEKKSVSLASSVSPSKHNSSSADCSNKQLNEKSSHAVIIGLGQSGLATAVFLHKQGLEIDVYDSSNEPALAEKLTELLPEATLHRGSLAVDCLRIDSLLVVSPGVPLAHPEIAPLLQYGIRPVGDVEIFAQCVKKPVIAITGSNGKSTVTALVGEILRHAGMKVAVAGNIGVPVLTLLEDSKYDIYVLELSSFQLETTWSLKPALAVVLNIAADHMDRYENLNDYIATKLKVYQNCVAILVNDDEPAVNLGAVLPTVDERTLNKVLHFSASEPESEYQYGLKKIDGDIVLLRGNQKLIEAKDILLAGTHNLQNVLAAWAIANNSGVRDEVIKAAVLQFKGLAHRMQLLGTHGGVSWVNDSKGTNVGATVAALEGLEQPVILIAGGVAKDADFSVLRESIKHRSQIVRSVILIGRDASLIKQAIEGVVIVFEASTMSDAVTQAIDIAIEGDVVLLSPACASFDMYKNFEQRGDDFIRCVEALA